jgi:cytochrome P450
LIAQRRGEIDCMAGLLTQVTVDIVREYFGIPDPEPDFALWLHVLNLASFPHLAPNPVADQAAKIASLLVGPRVDDAIQQAKAAPDSRTILGRYVLAQRTDPNVLTDDAIRASIVGFMLGFVPTNNRCNGQIMEFLLRRPDAMAAAQSAARSGDDDLLHRVLFEALRFRPLFLGPMRTCLQDQKVAAGTRRQTTIRKGTMILASTLSASFDPRRVPNPNQFNPDRGIGDAMRFGWGQHWCIGYGIAIAQITHTFKPLLVRGNVRRAAGVRGQPAYFGPFYEHLHVTYGQ